MGLLSPQRLQTIHILSLEKYVCNFRTLQAQNSSANYSHQTKRHQAELVCRLQLCSIVSTTAEYIKRTQELRGNQTALPISITKQNGEQIYYCTMG